MLFSNFKITVFFLFIFLFTGFISCSKKSDDTADNMVKEADMENINNNDFSETDEDLLNVDYKEFYDELAPHGEWIEVKGSDIGVNLKKETSSGKSHRTVSISDLLGVKDALAEDVSFGAFFVWKPAPNLAVGIAAGEPVAYTPYTNGQWIYSSNGWYFKAASEPEEITHHYGRWVYSPAMGWLWVPGRVWAPAWVDWREQDEYIAWAPVPPGVYIINNVIVTPPVYEERYVIIEKRYFIEPEIYRYTFKENKHKIKITEWRRTDGIMVINNTVINQGPDVTLIKSITGKTFEPVTIKYVTGKNKVKYSDNEYDVYSPEFKKVKKETKVKGPVSKPKEFSDYQSASQREFGKNEKKAVGNENSDKKELKDKTNNNKENPEKNFKERKYIDDKDMKNGKNNQGNEKHKSDKNKDYNNEKGKDKGKDNNINNKSGNKDNKGKDKNYYDKGNNDKGNKDKGNKKYRNDSYKPKEDKKQDKKNNGNLNDKNSEHKDNNGKNKKK